MNWRLIHSHTLLNLVHKPQNFRLHSVFVAWTFTCHRVHMRCTQKVVANTNQSWENTPILHTRAKSSRPLPESTNLRLGVKLSGIGPHRINFKLRFRPFRERRGGETVKASIGKTYPSLLTHAKSSPNGRHVGVSLEMLHFGSLHHLGYVEHHVEVANWHKEKIDDFEDSVASTGGVRGLTRSLRGMQRRGTQKSKVGTHKQVQLSATQVMWVGV